MWNEPSKVRLAKIPKLYETEEIPLKDKLIYLHFFIGSCDWYVAEYDHENDLFWGFAILNGDYEMAEWGYVSFVELKSITLQNGLEIDCELEEIWKIRKASLVKKICFAQGWKTPGRFENGNMRIPPGHESREHFHRLND